MSYIWDNKKPTALYDRFINQGAVMGDSFGLENVLWFANNKEDAYEEPTIKRSRSHNYVSKEVITSQVPSSFCLVSLTTV
jgi:dimethylglycine dehydrogenase